MKIEQFAITFHTSGRGTQDITADIATLLSKTPIQQGLCHLFLKHTSASLMLCENYDPQVRKDLEQFLVRLIPDGDPLFKHVIEGQDDMPAHIRTLLTQTSLTLPIQNGKLALGTWQGIYLYEHRYQAQERHLLSTVVGD
ncbi:secondary thiamine-phosphate synthase enzyme YjbQ [Legionella sp. PC997]|uniref:secondary thiamine-phosphate synthase enzyme YjbQ n=1 Tax=Legionella sp. PC997 TaxID=2755562 RepID=UPI0015F9DE5A|nr:secondary thiamine-phosphate synthase enzyme YjbQ [Legionella sp. PC997]QMT59518.1 secondary thiamine-phosphate synthase enzyme [Legionella sp. PC997]